MDPMLKLWMYESWCQDHIDKNEFAKQFSIFLGSFFNPEAAQQMLKGDVIESDDEEFEQSWSMVTKDIEAAKPKRRRRRKKVL
jgi:hypothetical protein